MNTPALEALRDLISLEDPAERRRALERWERDWIQTIAGRSDLDLSLAAGVRNPAVFRLRNDEAMAQAIGIELAAMHNEVVEWTDLGLLRNEQGQRVYRTLLAGAALRWRRKP